MIDSGSPIDEDDLIFHTLRGLPKVFNGLRTTVRAMITRGEHAMFDEVVNMLHAEYQQLLQDSNTELDTGTVLVATTSQNGQSHGGTSHGGAPSLIQSFGQLGVTNQVSTSTQGQMYPSNQMQTNFGGHSMGQMQPFYEGSTNSVLGPAPHPNTISQSQGVPQAMNSQQQFFPTYSSGFKGRGRRPPRAICGRSNHTTNYCYYRN